MNIAKKISKIIPSILDNIFGPLKKESFAKSIKMNTENKVKGIPFFITTFLTFINMKNAIAPKISSIFAILLPIMFPNPISEVPPIEENILIVNSGIDVEKAKTVNPIINGVIFRSFPKDDAPSIK